MDEIPWEERTRINHELAAIKSIKPGLLIKLMIEMAACRLKEEVTFTPEDDEAVRDAMGFLDSNYYWWSHGRE